MTHDPQHSDCPVCGYHFAVPFLKDEMPLATIAWPASAQEARAMKALPLDYMQCLSCTHVYNQSFCYENVPYDDKPNLMFNQGANWKGFIGDILSHFDKTLPEAPSVVEIGHGDGSFLNAISEMRAHAKCTGFDPNGAASGSSSVTFRQELFDPLKHMAEYKPDLIIMRHIVEHLEDPLSFLQGFALASDLCGHSARFYIETPCIDRVMETGRTVDFYYEHPNQFTTRSFTALFKMAGFEVEEIAHGYDREVIYTHAKTALNGDYKNISERAASYCTQADEAISHVLGQVKKYLDAGKSIAIWGGTGKSAAFMNRYGLDSALVPLVVDSDDNKHGTFVPGTAQEIVSPDILINSPVDIVIIPPQWRALDITQEMDKKGINPERVLIEDQGALVDFR